MAFQVTPNVRVSTDADGNVVHLSHLQEPHRAAALGQPTTAELAASYARDVADLYGFARLGLRAHENPSAERDPGAGTELRAEEEKHLRGSSTVAYRQTHDGLPIWDATLQVHLTADDPRVTSSASTLHREPRFDPAVSDPDIGLTDPPFDDAAFAKVARAERRQKAPEVTRRRLMW